jgi:hypothetical protein
MIRSWPRPAWVPLALALLCPAAAVAAAPAGAGESATTCVRVFDAPPGSFEADKVAGACREESAQDARAMQRLGLLTLAGLGVARDAPAAAKLCADANLRDARVSSGFCVAAATAELRRTGGVPAGLPGPSGSAAPSPDVLAAIDRLRQASNQGSRAAAAELCGIYFDARDGGFDPVQTVDWCRRAAGFGDAQALVRIGLMRLWGVGLERSLPEADALCTEAESRDRAVGAAFCLAAVVEERKMVAATFTPPRSMYPAPWPAASDPRLSADALGPDRALEALHTTATGLRYTCRDLIRWSRYGGLIDPNVFGRPIEHFDDRDYASLDAAAAECATAVGPYDTDGSERALLASFRQTLPALRARQTELARATQQHQAEQVDMQREQHEIERRVVVAVSNLSPTQQACIDAIQRSWTGRASGAAFGSLEIRSATTRQVNGNSVVSGEASALSPSAAASRVPYAYSCSFAGSTQTITGRTLRQAGPASVAASGH